MTIKVKMPYPRVGGIGRVGDMYKRYLPQFGIEFVEKNPDLLVGHAGNLSHQVDVEHNHGLWWTGDMPDAHSNYWKGNARGIQSLRAAKIVTVPSNWVKLNIARGMHISPRVIPHGVEWSEWRHVFSHKDYVLWNKARDRDVCDPSPVHQLAQRFPKQQFVSTFVKRRLPNIQVMGRVSYQKMKPLVQHAQVYLATTKETFGIGTLEAMASGVPILGYDWGGTADLITHKENGYLVQPGDISGLADGLAYCTKHRKRLGDTARATAKKYTWLHVAEMVAGVYTEALALKRAASHDITIVIPAYNYDHVVGRAITSCLRQTRSPAEIIVVDDGSPDRGATKRAVEKFKNSSIPVRYVRQENAGVAHARNLGVSLAKTDLVCCLDADDQIAPGFLEATVPAFKNPLIGITYTSLMLINPDGSQRKKSGWPPNCNFDQQIIGRNQVPTCCVFRKRAWVEAGGQRQRYAPQGAGTEDAAGWLSIGANGWQIKRVTDEPLFLYTLGGRTWNKKKYHKTDWLGWHPFTRDKRHPFASIATPEKASHPVIQLDIPKVSVIIPVGPAHTEILTDALDSLEAQTFRKWEAIVVNDSGKELNLTPWPYATLIETPGGKGAGYARNRGIEIAKADEVVCLDADDFLQWDALKRFMAARRKHPDTWIYPDMWIYKASGEVEHHSCSDFSPAELWRRGIGPVTCLYTKEMWEKVGGFDEESHREDWDFHLRLARAGYCGIRIAEPLLTYRHLTGTRRASGSIRKEAVILHEKYDREELVARCSACSKRARPGGSREVGGSASTPMPKNFMTKAEAGWKEIEFVGGNRNDLRYRGVTGRKYIAGNNDAHRVVLVHPKDYDALIRLKFFEPHVPKSPAATMQASVGVAQSAPQPHPQPELFDILNMTLAQVRQIDMKGQNMNKLIKVEETRTDRAPRSTILRELRAEQRRRQAQRRGQDA